MFHYKRIVRLRETDATGVIFFSELLNIALETFEHCLAERGHHLDELIRHGEFLIPIVHAEADFFAPIRVGDHLNITLNVASVGDSSFTLSSQLMKADEEVGRATIVHVAVSKKTGESMAIPAILKDLLDGL